MFAEHRAAKNDSSKKHKGIVDKSQVETDFKPKNGLDEETYKE